MTPEEAIQQLEFDRATILFDSLTGEEITPEMLKLINKENYLTYVADGIAIEALKEVQQYREIGTVKECKEMASIVKKSERSELAKIIDEWLKYRKIGTVEECKEMAVIANKKTNPDELAKIIVEWIQYNKIGTVEECREAVEKQRAKKPKELDTEYGYFICGNCGGAIAYTDDFKSHKYCLNCGQAIQWDENLEGMRDE